MKEEQRNHCYGLYEIAAAVNSERTIEGVLDSIVVSVASALGARACTVMLLTPDRKTLLRVAAHGLSDYYLNKGPVSAHRSISDALEGRPVAILDATTDERGQYRGHASREGIKSILSVPMKLKQDIVGVVRAYTAEERQFSEDDIAFLMAVANLGAIALENARSYESIEKDNETLRQELLQWGMTWVAAHRD